jgi:hypothetical protein
MTTFTDLTPELQDAMHTALKEVNANRALGNLPPMKAQDIIDKYDSVHGWLIFMNHHPHYQEEKE